MLKYSSYEKHKISISRFLPPPPPIVEGQSTCPIVTHDLKHSILTIFFISWNEGKWRGQTCTCQRKGDTIKNTLKRIWPMSNPSQIR